MAYVRELDATTTSNPYITFTDTVTDAGGIYAMTMPKPQEFKVTTVARRLSNESLSGRVETHLLHDRDFIEIGWTHLGPGSTYEGEVGLEDLLIMYHSVKDGSTFTFKRHTSVGTAGYPGTSGDPTSVPLHANQWTVRLARDADAFVYQEISGAKDRFAVKLKMEEVVSS